jgi:hypothetical protein
MSCAAPKAMRFYNSHPLPPEQRDLVADGEQGVSEVAPILKKLPKRNSIISPALAPSILQTS